MGVNNVMFTPNCAKVLGFFFVYFMEIFKGTNAVGEFSLPSSTNVSHC